MFWIYFFLILSQITSAAWIIVWMQVEVQKDQVKSYSIIQMKVNGFIDAKVVTGCVEEIYREYLL